MHLKTPGNGLDCISEHVVPSGFWRPAAAPRPHVRSQAPLRRSLSIGGFWSPPAILFSCYFIAVSCYAFCGFTKLAMWKHIARVKNFCSTFPSVVTLVVVRTTKKIVGPPDPRGRPMWPVFSDLSFFNLPRGAGRTLMSMAVLH